MSKLIDAEAARRKIANYLGREEGLFAPNYDTPIFDPAKRPADDYYCLKGVRQWRQDQFEKFCKIVCRKWTERLEKLTLLELYIFKFGMYETGDYMNAYLEVMEDE